MTQNAMKQAVAHAALQYVEDNSVVGIGTGSTVDFFIDALVTIKHKIDGVVVSSDASAARLKSHHIPVFDLNSVNSVPVYIDGADEFTLHKQLIKGGGGALTREKIIAAVADKFVCIADISKQVDVLGQFPLPIEVIPMARSYVARQLVKLGGNPEYRDGFVTDNGNIILDTHNLAILEPTALEATINNITGVVCNGLFAKRPADVLLIGDKEEVRTL